MLQRLLRALRGRGPKTVPQPEPEEPLQLSVAVSQVGQGTTIEVSHQPCKEVLPQEKAALDLFACEEADVTTVSLVTLTGPSINFRARVYWSPFKYIGNCLYLLFVESTRTLFVGVNRYLGVVRVEPPQVLSEHEVFLFWNFEHIHGCVLVRSELECFLFLPTGVPVGSVPVDPPWEEYVGEAGMEFDSPVYGRHGLAWPDAI